MYIDSLGLFNFHPRNDQISAKTLNTVQCDELLGRLCNIGLSRFTWEGLPETCNERALEMQLFFFGKALFFDDDTLGYCHTQVELPGPFNIYYESIKREAYSYNYHKTYTDENSVIISANKTRTPDYLIPFVYSPKITNALRAVDVHIETLKRPFLIRCDDKEKRSVQAAINKIADNEVAVVGSKFSNANDFSVLSLGQQCYISDMWACAKNYMNQCLSALGVDNNYSEKKERLVVSESVGEGNATRHSLESELKMREIACKEINEMFGLNVSVYANQIEVFAEELLPYQGIGGAQAGNSQEEGQRNDLS